MVIESVNIHEWPTMFYTDGPGLPELLSILAYRGGPKQESPLL